VGRVCPRHGGGGRPLNAIVIHHEEAANVSAKRSIKILAIVMVSVISLGGAFVGGARFSNAQRDAQERSGGALNASRLVAILRQVDSGGETCHAALERELDNALIRTGYGTGQPDLSPSLRAYLKEAAAYRKEHPYRTTHSYTDYVKRVLDLAERNP
jgi:hypothetical protein